MLNQRNRKFLELVVDKKLDDNVKIVFSNAAFMLFGLPVRALPGNPAFWQRRTSLYNLTITRNIEREIPFGVYARLNQIYIDSQVTRTKSNRIYFATSMSEYAKKLSIKKGYANQALFRQLLNYVTASINISPKVTPSYKAAICGVNSFVGRAWNIVFHLKNPDNIDISNGYVELDELYAKFIMEHAVPLDLNLLRFFKSNTLAIDFYRYLVYRTNNLNKEIYVPILSLLEHLGTEHSTPRVIKSRLIKILKVIKIYWEVNARFEDRCLVVSPSPPAIQTMSKKKELSLVDVASFSRGL